MKRSFMRTIALIAALSGFFAYSISAENPPAISHRLPADVLPALGCWFWHDREFEPEGYREFVDAIDSHSSYNLLTASLRVPLMELTDENVHAQIKEAVIYAREKGVSVAMDLDVRLARRAFQSLYPGELQQMLLLQETELNGKGEFEIGIRSRELSDHYTGRTTPYIALQGSLVRVYSYIRQPNGIDPESLQDITGACSAIEESSAEVKVRIPREHNMNGRKVCAMALFTHLAADVFAPHLLDFQRQILKQYADVPLAGACKDEWGFPPCFDGNPAKDQFWYSNARAGEYAKRTNGRELLADCLLMSKGIRGKEKERIAAINHFMEMSCQRNGADEQDFYAAVKEVFGAAAVVATHPTWWPYPNAREMMKNGLDWWIARRDWAQTDELTPFAARTALAKKWGSPLWYNMFYSSEKSDYEKSVWTHALAGGRINYHPLYPKQGGILENSLELLRGGLARAESRVRLLNYIARCPLDCPVAVIFGHASAMNWAGAGYNDVGMEIANALWQAGYPADLIPSSEIENHSLTVTQEGWIQYGSQRYSAVVLYHPEYSRPAIGEFFQKVDPKNTALFRAGNWTLNFEGNALQQDEPLPKSMKEINDPTTLVGSMTQSLREKRITPQTPATAQLKGFDSTSASPSTEGFCRLQDGTVILVAGTKDVAGDPIQKTIAIQNHKATIEAVGVAAVRLDAEGKLDALAAGSLKEFYLEGLDISLPTPIDLALWKNADGRFHGVVQNYQEEIPDELKRITKDWTYLALPAALPNSQK